MKKIIISCLSIALLLSLVSCSVVENKSNPLVLANGTVIDSDVKSKLMALEGDYNEMIKAPALESRALNETGGIVTERPELTAAKELLVREFGQDGLKYIGTELIGVKKVGQATNPDGVQSREVVVVRVGPGIDMYCYLYCTYWPWGTYNYAITSCIAPGTEKQAWISDDVTNNAASPRTVLDAYAFGSLKSGFYPPRPRNVVTTHGVWGPGVDNGAFGWEQHWY